MSRIVGTFAAAALLFGSASFAAEDQPTQAEQKPKHHSMAKGAAARGAAPDFSLTDSQRDALLAFAATDRSSLRRDTPVEFAARQINELRCIACHTRAGLSGMCRRGARVA